MYFNYNDYELIYLINEGSLGAFKALFRKYDHLIMATIGESYPYGDKSKDLAQEGRMILFDCVRRFKPEMGVTFYSYFYICFKRKLGKELEKEYYKNYIPFNENLYSDLIMDLKNVAIVSYIKSYYRNDEVAQLIIEENLLRGTSIHKIAIKYGINYHELYRKKTSIIRSMKKVLTNLIV